MIVLDTAALLFWTLEPARLSPAADGAIASADRIQVSAISIWEIAIKVKHGRLSLPVSVRDFDARLAGVQRVEVIAVDAALWLANVDLDWSHRDPADRTIVALAMRSASPLVSSDRMIRSFYAGVVW